MTATVFVPLQYGLPASIEILVTVLVLLVVVLVPTIWVYRDAERRGMNAALWAVVVGGLLLIGLVPGVIAFVLYVWKRGDTATRRAGT